MEILGKIRRLYLRDKLSLHEITKRTGLSRNTIRRWLRSPKGATPPRYRRREGLVKLAAFCEAVEQALKADAHRSKQNRRTAKALFAQIKADGYAGGYTQLKPFENVDQARIRFLTDAEAQRLVNACPADLRNLVRAALLTGARRGELAALKVADVNLKTAQIYISESKSGKPRHVPLNSEGLAHFREALTGKLGDQLVFTRADGAAWGHNYHVRALKDACKKAKVKPMVVTPPHAHATSLTSFALLTLAGNFFAILDFAKSENFSKIFRLHPSTRYLSRFLWQDGTPGATIRWLELAGIEWGPNLVHAKLPNGFSDVSRRHGHDLAEAIASRVRALSGSSGCAARHSRHILDTAG
jgi:integrase